MHLILCQLSLYESFDHFQILLFLCQMQLIAKDACLDSHSLKATIGSLLAVCNAILPAYFDHASNIRPKEESHDPQAAGCILVSIFDVLTDFEKVALFQNS
jgi:hypothetical protein